MSDGTDHTHEAALRSWVESANDPHTDFPIQNLPFGRFRREPDDDWSVGIAIGEKVLDLAASGLTAGPDIKQVMQLGSAGRKVLRHALSEGLRHGSKDEANLKSALVSQSAVEIGLPCDIGD